MSRSETPAPSHGRVAVATAMHVTPPCHPHLPHSPRSHCSAGHCERVTVMPKSTLTLVARLLASSYTSLWRCPSLCVTQTTLDSSLGFPLQEPPVSPPQTRQPHTPLLVHLPLRPTASLQGPVSFTHNKALIFYKDPRGSTVIVFVSREGHGSTETNKVGQGHSPGKGPSQDLVLG